MTKIQQQGQSFCIGALMDKEGRQKDRQRQRYTVCPGSSDPPENYFNIFASEN